MSDEYESHVEHISEKLHGIAERAREGWIKWSALLSALLAVFSAIGGLESAHHANSAMIAQIQASDQWSYYQAKGIKGMVSESENATLSALGKPAADGSKRVEKYRDEQQEAKEKATHLAEDSQAHLRCQEMFSRAVTMFQVSVAIIAVAVLARLRYLIVVPLTVSLLGLWSLAQAFLLAP